ncbi:hypothetical protein DIPPA_60573 [Diplonema papillatum]|nr:hypothetical protein DIPPA_60573 [Diplonema papillatum]
MKRWRDDPHEREDRFRDNRDRGRDFRDRDRDRDRFRDGDRDRDRERGGRRDDRDRGRDGGRDPRDAKRMEHRDENRDHHGGRDDRGERDRMPPPTFGRSATRQYSVDQYRQESMPPPRMDPRSKKERSMTIEAPALNPYAKVDSIICQACAEDEGTIVCYDCSDVGAVYCENCYQMIHADASMRLHTNKGPLLRCKRGDCTGKYAAWWCSICNDVCADCAKTKCSAHRDNLAVLVKAGTKNAEMTHALMEGQQAVQQRKEESESSESSSDNSSESESSDSDSGSEKRRRKRRKSGEDRVVPTWGRSKDEERELGLKGEAVKGGKGMKGGSGMDPAGLQPNPLRYKKLPGREGHVGMPPPIIRYTCDYCSTEIMGMRFTCTECIEPRPYDLCQTCFTTVSHKHDLMLQIFGFSLQTILLPSALKKLAKAGKDRDRRGRSPEAGRGDRDVSPCKKYWEGRCSEPCPWGRPHIKQDRPDHCCYICGGTGHFAKECQNRRRLEGGEAEEVRRQFAFEEYDDGIGINTVLQQLAKPVATEEERLSKGIATIAQLQERVTKLAKLRKKKKLRKAGVDVSDDEETEEQLLKGVEKLAPPEKNATVKPRQPTPELEEIFDMDYCARIGAPPPRTIDELNSLNAKDIYDAATERAKGAAVPEKSEETEWDQEYFDHFETCLNRVNEPLWTPIDTLVFKEVVKNKKKHVEIMCVIEARLQQESLTPVQLLSTWYVLDAILKQCGGHFVRDIEPNLQAIVESFLPSVLHKKWRRRCRDMLRSWYDIFPRRYAYRDLNRRC